MKSSDTLIEFPKRPSHASSKETAKREERDQHQAIVKDAFQKAKNIVEAAENYSLNKLKESTMRMNEECAQMKIRSYEDGYSLGLAEGQKEGNTLGYQNGYEEGLKKATEENNLTRDDLCRMLETVEKKKAEILDQFEENLEGLSIAIAKKIIKKELSTDGDSIQAMVLNVMESYRNQEWVRICVSKNTADLLTKSDHNIIQALKDISDNVKIVSDSEMNDGDCKIDLPDRLIDAGIDTQLDSIKTALKIS